MKKSPSRPNKTKNMLYTGTGDNGTTTLFDCQQGRISKSASLIEALGSVDELNAYLGVVKVNKNSDKIILKVGNKKILFCNIIDEIQEKLFIIQAEIGGSLMFVDMKELIRIEKIINVISKALPPITSFTISGGSIISSSLDFARTLARKAERRVISVNNDGSRVINKNTISYLNRLSSVLFAMSRYANYYFSVSEKHPNYK